MTNVNSSLVTLRVKVDVATDYNHIVAGSLVEAKPIKARGGGGDLWLVVYPSFLKNIVLRDEHVEREG